MIPDESQLQAWRLKTISTTTTATARGCLLPCPGASPPTSTPQSWIGTSGSGVVTHRSMRPICARCAIRHRRPWRTWASALGIRCRRRMSWTPWSWTGCSGCRVVDRVGAAAAKAVQVERDVAVAQLVQPGADLRAHLRLYQQRQALGVDLDARDLVVRAHAQVMHAEGADEALCLFNHADGLHGDGLSMRDTRREASHGRLVPGGQPQPARELAYLQLVQSGVEQRPLHLPLGRCRLPRPVVAHVVGVDAVGKVGDAQTSGQRTQFGEQLGLAM